MIVAIIDNLNNSFASGLFINANTKVETYMPVNKIMPMIANILFILFTPFVLIVVVVHGKD